VAHDLPTADIALLDLLTESIVADRPNARYLLWPVLRTLLDSVREHERPPLPLSHTGRSARAVLHLKQYLERNYAEELSHEDFTSLTGLARSTVCNVFKEVVGASPLGYLNDIRLNHACHLLRTSQLPIAEIAGAVGIRDANYFSRLFRKRFGTSPSQYARQAQKPAEGPILPGTT
jgi:transcriptional regulator GlxA family with amidase domain